MATTRKTTKKTDISDDILLEDNIVNETSEKIPKEMLDMMATYAKQIEELQKQLDAKNSENEIFKTEDSANHNKMIKVTSMLNNTYNLTTTKRGVGGRTYTFEKYGQTIPIRYKDLLDIVSLYSDQFEKGWVILSKKQDYIDLDVGYMYDDIFDKNKLEKIISLKTKGDVDIILELEDVMLDSVLSLIAERISKGFNYDFNILEMLKQETDINDYINAFNEDK